MKNADAFLGSLIFDYDDALAVKQLLPHVKGPRFIFESADEIMPFNRVGNFRLSGSDDSQKGPAGPPAAVKAILSKFSSGREEDKLLGYIKLLKVGPDLLKYIPGDNTKVADLRTWLEVYRYWNQGGRVNISSMLQLIANTWRRSSAITTSLESRWVPPPLQVTPDLGLLHPLLLMEHSDNVKHYIESPAEYLNWRLSEKCSKIAREKSFQLAPSTAPRVAFLLFRKHVITEQRYISDLITCVEKNGIIPIPIFINGVEAHTIVRDLLTSQSLPHHEQKTKGKDAVMVDAVVSTIGFPLVGGPAGSMEAGRNIAVAKDLLRSLNVPYFIAAPLLLQSIPSWRKQGVQGLQSVVLYALPELDGAIDTVVLGGLVGDKIALVPERVRKLTSRIHGWVDLRRTPPQQRRIAISIYGFPPNVGAVGTAALLDVPKSLEKLLHRLATEGYDVGGFELDKDASGESLVAALAVLSENPSITAGAGDMQNVLNKRIERAASGDPTTAATLGKPGGGLGGAVVKAFDVSRNQLDEALGKYMANKVRTFWSEKEVSPGVSITVSIYSFLQMSQTPQKSYDFFGFMFHNHNVSIWK
jgi:magnesium chelatase subunit H